MKNLKIKYRKAYKASLREDLLKGFAKKKPWWSVVLKYSFVPVLVLGFFAYGSLNSFDSGDFLNKAYAAQALLIERLEDNILYFKAESEGWEGEFWFSPQGDKLKKWEDQIELNLVEGDRFFYKDNFVYHCYDDEGIEVECMEDDQLNFTWLPVTKEMEVEFSTMLLYGDDKEGQAFAEAFYSLDEDFYLTDFSEREDFIGDGALVYEDAVVNDGVQYQTYLLKEPEMLDKPREYENYVRFYFNNDDFTLAKLEWLDEVDGELIVRDYIQYRGFEFIPMSEYDTIFDPEKYGLRESVDPYLEVL